MPGIDNNTLLMLHGEEFSDDSEYSLPITNGGVTISSDQSKFGGKSFYFNGSSSFKVEKDRMLSDSNDFTIDWWEYIIPPMPSSGMCPFTMSTNPPYFMLYYSGSNVQMYIEGAGNGTIIDAVVLGSWVHRALVRSGNIIRFFRDGNKVYEGSMSGENPYFDGYGFVVGGRTGLSQYFKGYIDEFRISNVARWTEDFDPPTKPYSPENQIEVTLNRENGRTTYCRQFTYNPKGEYNSRLQGAVVSGTPVAGMPISELPVGSKIALTDSAKLSPNEVGYIVIQQNEDTVYLTTDAHQVTGTWTGRDTAAQQFITDMTEAAKAVCTLVKGALTATQIGYHGYQETGEVLTYFQSDVTTKRAFWSDWWTDSLSQSNTSHQPLYCRSSGSISDMSISSANTTHALRPLLSIPSSTLVSAEPNSSGAYELV